MDGEANISRGFLNSEDGTSWVEGDMGEDTLDRLREGLSLDGKRLKRAGIKKPQATA